MALPAVQEAIPRLQPRGRTMVWEWCALLLFIGLLTVTLVRHEMWCDELQAWQIARYSRSLPELFANFRYEGHPSLWFLLLFAISRFTDNPVSMQVLHGLIATVTATLILFYAPFPRWQRLLLIFGYFFVYEYAVVSRNYAQDVLLLVLFCLCWSSRVRGRPLLLGVILALLAQTNCYAILLTVILGIWLVIEGGLQWRREGTRLQPLAFVGAGLVVCSLLAAVHQVLPPPDREIIPTFVHLVPYRIGSTIVAVWNSFVPIPQIGAQFWPKNVLNPYPWCDFLRAAASLVILVLATLTFRRARRVLLLFLAGAICILIFTYTIYSGSLRHYGHLFTFFLVCQWLMVRTPAPAPAPALVPAPRWQRAFLVTVLSLQAVAGLLSCVMDWVKPFSSAQSVVAYITDHHLRTLTVYAYEDWAAIPVAGYLRTPVFHLQRGEYGSFCYWDLKRPPLASPQVAADLALRKVEANGQPALLLLNGKRLPLDPTHFRFLRYFPHGTTDFEHYSLYLIEP